MPVGHGRNMLFISVPTPKQRTFFQCNDKLRNEILPRRFSDSTRYQKVLISCKIKILRNRQGIPIDSNAASRFSYIVDKHRTTHRWRNFMKLITCGSYRLTIIKICRNNIRQPTFLFDCIFQQQHKRRPLHFFIQLF